MLGGVGHGLPGGGRDVGQALVEVDVARLDQIHRDTVPLLDAAGGVGQGTREGGLAPLPATVQPGAQVALLGPGEHLGTRRILGPLDQGERLEHRVVQPGGHGHPFLGADALRALTLRLGARPGDARSEEQDDARGHHRGGHTDRRGAGEPACLGEQDRPGAEDQREGRPGAGHPGQRGAHAASGGRHGDGAAGVPPREAEVGEDEGGRPGGISRPAWERATATDAARITTAVAVRILAGSGGTGRPGPGTATARAA